MQCLTGCHIYTSEGRDAKVIAHLQGLCGAQPDVLLASSFVDAPYHRSSFTLVSRSPDALATAVERVTVAALSVIDLRNHNATHPRLGAVDHISCHPVPDAPLKPSLEQLQNSSSSSSRSGNGSSGSTSSCSARVQPSEHASTSGSESGDAPLRAAVHLARSIGQRLSTGAASLPVYFYGAARDDGMRLAEIRRQLGYFGFDNARNHSWQGAIASGLTHFPPDLGPSQVDPSKGVITIGAVPWIINFNVPVVTGDMAAARRIARAVSERGGGLKGVEAMALSHSEGVIEVACNLLEPWVSPPQVVEAAIEAAAAKEGLVVQASGSYVIGKLPHDITAAADEQL